MIFVLFQLFYFMNKEKCLKNQKLLSYLILFWSEIIYQTWTKGPYIFTTQNIIDFENTYPCPFEWNPKFNSWFEPNQSTTTRSVQNMTVLKEVICKKTRYMKSPIPNLTNILNMHLNKLKNNKQTEWNRIHDHIDFILTNH